VKKISFILLAWLPFVLFLCMGAWDNTEPADNRTWDTSAGKIRDNWNTLEVALGVDISMEGSASPWYQSGAPTTTADGSTGLSASNNGLLWVDSDNRVLNTYINGTGFVGIDSIPNVVTFTASDKTPTVLVGRTFKTDSGTLTISDFDDGPAGKTIFIESMGTITFDTTTAVDDSNNLDGSSANIVTALGDVTVWETSNGTTWNLVRWNDASADQTDFATVTYVDAQDSASGVTLASVTVFNTTLTAANTFQDLDLSGTVGSNVALVYLEITSTSADFYTVKQKGANGTFAQRTPGGGSQGYGATFIDFETNDFANVVVVTDASGVIEHAYANNSATITVIVRGYIK